MWIRKNYNKGEGEQRPRDIFPCSTLFLSWGFDECVNVFRSRSRENISCRLCADFERAVKDGKWSSARERLRRKKNRFINSIRLPLHFPSVLRFSLPLNVFVRVPKWPFSRRARVLAPIQPIRSIRRHISLFVIASNSSGRYPTGDKSTEFK